jgi:uncharacterized protein DUF4412
MRLLFAAALGLSTLPALAQPGMMGGPRGPQFSGAMSKLFGDNTAFSASLENEINLSSQGEDMKMTLPGKLAFDSGKARFEMDLTQMKGGPMPPGAAEQIKAMGMDKMVVISRPEKKMSYMIYPNLQSYAEMAIEDPDAAKTAADFKIETTALGKETIDGHACVKNKAIVTDGKGEKHESTVWNATDLKNFPVKIETSEEGTKIVMVFKDVKLAKPAATSFEPPTDYKKYDNMMTMMQEQVMKRMGGPRGAGGGMGGPPQN